jgi:precorrin-6B methylase 2
MLKRATLVLVILSFIPALSPAIGASDHPQNVILFGWDGARRDHIKKYLKQKKLPNLQKLINEGTFVEIDVEGKTDTTAGWVQILTGYYPEVTGVYGNYQYKPIPKNLSIFERLEKHFGPDKFVSIAIIGQSDNFGTAPPKKIKVPDEDRNSKSSPTMQADKAANSRQPQGTFWRESGRRYRIVPGQPYYITAQSMDLFESGLKENEKISARVIELLEKYKDKPFFFLVNFADADNTEKKYKESSKEYKNALISNDLWTGRIMAKVRDIGLGDKTQFYITAAHGCSDDEKGHNFSPNVFLVTNNKKVNRSGRRQDVAPTILEAFGLDLNKLKPVLDGISLTKFDNRPPIEVQSENRKPDVPYVTTPQEVVDKMLELAKIQKDDLVYDLGCGDGRFVITAAKKYGCKGVGYDISPRRVRESRENVKKNGLEDLVKIEQKDIFTLDLSKADVITLFLLPSLNVKLIPQLDKLKPGSRIVSYNFGMRGVVPDKTIKFTSPKDNSQHTIYLWSTPLNKIWMWKNGQPNPNPNRR